MNKKGNILYFGILIIVFILFWIFGLSTFITLAGTSYIQAVNPTGMELWFYSNLNLVVGIGLLIAVLTYGAIQSR